MHCLLAISKQLTIGLALLFALASFVHAQATVSATLPASPTIVAPAPAPPRLGFVAALGIKCKNCKARFHNSPLGLLLKSAKGPLSIITGGLVPPPGAPHPAHGPPPGPPPPAVGAAAKIKQEQAAAVGRRDAVRYLATVDCHWYPEAEAALIASLRADRSECVRYEAATALGSGCCCTKRTIEALRIAAAGSHRDGNPGERSMRVRLTAYHSLQNCLCNCSGELLQTTPAYESRPESPEQPLGLSQSESNVGQGGGVVLSAYYEQLASRSAQDVLQGAQQTLAVLNRQNAEGPSAHEPAQETLRDIWVASGSPVRQPTPHETQNPLLLPSVMPASVEIRRLPADQPEPVYLGRESQSTWR